MSLTLPYLIFLKLSPKPFTAFSSYDLASNSTELQIFLNSDFSPAKPSPAATNVGAQLYPIFPNTHLRQVGIQEMLLWFNTTTTMVAYCLIYLFCCGSSGEKVSPEVIRKWHSLLAHRHPLTSLLCLPRLYLKYWFSICLKTEAELASKHFNARPVWMWHFPKRWRKDGLVPLHQELNPQRLVRCSATLWC